MPRVIVLDAGPAWLAIQPAANERAGRLRSWLIASQAGPDRVVLPAIAWYECRRELVRRGASAGLRRLDALRASLDYLPLTDEALTRASDLWASVRRRGLPTASPDALDADCILAAQALCLPDGVGRVAVLSSNVAHLSRFEGLETASLDDALGMETP